MSHRCLNPRLTGAATQSGPAGSKTTVEAVTPGWLTAAALRINPEEPKAPAKKLAYAL